MRLWGMAGQPRLVSKAEGESRNGWRRMLPYFCPPPVPLTCVCENPNTGTGIGAQPAFGSTPQSGPGFTIPNGMHGPGKVRPTPTLPMRGSTYCHTCATATVDNRQRNASKIFLILSSNNSYVQRYNKKWERTNILSHFLSIQAKAR